MIELIVSLYACNMIKDIEHAGNKKKNNKRLSEKCLRVCKQF